MKFSIFLVSVALYAQAPQQGSFISAGTSGGGGTCSTLAGDVTGSCAANTVVKVNGGAFPTDTDLVASNGSGQPVSSGIAPGNVSTLKTSLQIAGVFGGTCSSPPCVLQTDGNVGAFSSAFSILTPGTNVNTGSYLFGNGTSLGTTGSGIIAATNIGSYVYLSGSPGATQQVIVQNPTATTGITNFLIENGPAQGTGTPPTSPPFQVVDASLHHRVSMTTIPSYVFTVWGGTNNATPTLDISTVSVYLPADGSITMSGTNDSINAAFDIGLDRDSAGVFGVINGNPTSTAANYRAIKTASYQVGGTTFSITGCSAASAVGGSTAGQFTSGTTGACAVTITMGNGQTAPLGWACHAADLTTPASIYSETAYTITTASFTGTTVTGDQIVIGCLAF